MRMRETALFLLTVWNLASLSCFFPIWRGNSGDSRTFKAEIGTFMFAWIFRTFWFGSKWRFWGQNRGRVVRWWPQRTCSYFSGLLPLCHFWRKSIKKCDRESSDRQTDRQTHAETERQTEFIICPILYAIAMGHIKMNFCVSMC